MILIFSPCVRTDVMMISMVGCGGVKFIYIYIYFIYVTTTINSYARRKEKSKSHRLSLSHRTIVLKEYDFKIPRTF